MIVQFARNHSIEGMFFTTTKKRFIRMIRFSKRLKTQIKTYHKRYKKTKK